MHIRFSLHTHTHTHTHTHAHTHPHTHLSTSVWILYFKEDMTDIFCELMLIKEPQIVLKKLLNKAIRKCLIKTPKISEIDYFVTNPRKKTMTYVCLNFK